MTSERRSQKSEEEQILRGVYPERKVQIRSLCRATARHLLSQEQFLRSAQDRYAPQDDTDLTPNTFLPRSDWLSTNHYSLLTIH